jgi:hypothetical protein
MAKKAYKQVWKSVTGTPAEDFAGKRYHAVAYNADGDIITPAAGAPVVGILEEPNKVGEPAQVVAQGFMFAVLGGNVAAGQAVMTNAAGKFIAHVDGPTNYVAGIAHVGGVLDDIGTVLLK